MNRTDRLYAIVEELRAAAPRSRTVAQLAERFEVTSRTMHRDLLALQTAGVPCWSQPGPGGGYTIDPKPRPVTTIGKGRGIHVRSVMRDEVDTKRLARMLYRFGQQIIDENKTKPKS